MLFSLSCMRKNKLDWLETCGFTSTGQKCVAATPLGSTSQSVTTSAAAVNMNKPLLDNEFPPVFLNNEKLDRKVS